MSWCLCLVGAFFSRCAAAAWSGVVGVVGFFIFLEVLRLEVRWCCCLLRRVDSTF